MYTDILQQLGLPKNEAKIYEALISLGPSNASNISSSAKVNRRNVYDCLKNLLKRELVIKIAGAGEQLYKAVDPSKLQDILNNQKREVSEILPELKDLYKKKIPVEQAFISRGQEGIKNFWDYVMSQKETAYFVGGKGGWHDPKIEESRKKYFETCRKQEIKITGIFDHEMLEQGKEVYSEYDPKLIRFFPKGYSTNSTFDVCGDRVMFFSMPKQQSVENSVLFNIVSRDLADSYRKWYEYLWQKAISLKQ